MLIKKIFCLSLVALLTSLIIVGCGSSGGGNNISRGIPSFDIELEKQTLTVMQGSSAKLEINVKPIGSFSGEVEFSADVLKTSDVPPADQLSFNFTEVESNSYTLEVVASEEAAPGTLSLSIAGTSGRSVAKASLKLTIADEFLSERVVDFVGRKTPNREKVEVGGRFVVENIGQGRLVQSAPEVPTYKPDKERGTDTPQEDEKRGSSKGQYILFNAATKEEFNLTLEASLLDEFSDLITIRGRNFGNDPNEVKRSPDEIESPKLRAPSDNIKTQAWSNGVDSRTIKSPTTTWPWRTISQFTYGNSNNSGCTGTLVGPRHIITAAHCINQRGTNNWYTVKITPARNGVGVSPYGSTTVSVNPPAGQTVWYFTPSQWRNSNECKQGLAACRRWDWGLLIIPEKLGNQTGWMGYYAMAGNSLKNQNIYNRGYAQCPDADPDEPANCQTARLYGDSNTCQLGSFMYQGGDNWSDFIKHSCDVSDGHSGAPLYFYILDNNQYVPVVTAIHGYSDCWQCNAGSSYPAGARRLGPQEMSIISYFRNAFP